MWALTANAFSKGEWVWIFKKFKYSGIMNLYILSKYGNFI